MTLSDPRAGLQVRIKSHMNKSLSQDAAGYITSFLTRYYAGVIVSESSLEEQVRYLKVVKGRTESLLAVPKIRYRSEFEAFLLYLVKLDEAVSKITPIHQKLLEIESAFFYLRDKDDRDFGYSFSDIISPLMKKDSPTMEDIEEVLVHLNFFADTPASAESGELAAQWASELFVLAIQLAASEPK